MNALCSGPGIAERPNRFPVRESPESNLTMRIVHITDLHFGAHSGGLATSLVQRVTRLKPNLIVCTGDVVDKPHDDNLSLAKEFLGKLTSCCVPQERDDPPLIMVPGNHD